MGSCPQVGSCPGGEFVSSETIGPDEHNGSRGVISTHMTDPS